MEYVSETKSMYKTRMKGKLDEWAAKINKLKSHAETSIAEARDTYVKQVETLRGRKRQRRS